MNFKKFVYEYCAILFLLLSIATQILAYATKKLTHFEDSYINQVFKIIE